MSAKQSGNSEASVRSTTNRFHRGAIGESAKRWFVLLFNVVAVTLSVLTIYSCNFFSFHKIDTFDNVYTSTAELSYEPFEYLPKAGVGLFSYYFGDANGNSVLVNDRKCFYYCDEYTDYQWLSSNTKESGHGVVDLWLVARYCSILAPIIGMLAFFQSLFEIMCGSRISRWGNGGFLITQLFLIATFLQLGTFLVLFAPPIMYSTSAEDQKQIFCFSETSTVHCKMDAGSKFSMASALLYLVLAFLSFSVRFPFSCACDEKNDIVSDTDESDDSLFDMDMLQLEYIRRGSQEGHDIGSLKFNERVCNDTILKETDEIDDSLFDMDMLQLEYIQRGSQEGHDIGRIERNTRGQDDIKSIEGESQEEHNSRSSASQRNNYSNNGDYSYKNMEETQDDHQDMRDDSSETHKTCVSC